MTLAHLLTVVTVALATIGFVRFGAFAARLAPFLRRARATHRFDRVSERLAGVVIHVFGHRRMLRYRLSGLLHLFIFSGFVVLFLDIVETVGQPYGFSVGPVLSGLIDGFVVAVLIGVALAFWQRVVLRPERFRGSHRGDAYRVLFLITAIMVGILLHDSFFPFVARPLFHLSQGDASGHFVAAMLERLWRAGGLTRMPASAIGYVLGYLLDIGTVLAFLAYLPDSKHLHIVLAAPSVFFRRLPPTDGHLLEEVSADPVRSLSDLTWKDLLDTLTCTECGRCQDVCPAWRSRQVLSPKLFILELRDALRSAMRGEEIPRLAGGVVRAEELWDCTTCGACQEVCPVFIEHVPKIVGLRAALVEEGQLAGNAQDALESWFALGNAYGRPRRERGTWTEGLGFPVPDARREEVDVLWYVGDVASFDPQVTRITRLTARLLHRAGVRFGLLYDGEATAANDVLAMGELGLFAELYRRNIEALQEAKFHRILTTDPHTLRVLRQEYRADLVTPVLHVSELFLELVEQGLLTPRPLGIAATYHDPCYLARWAGLTDPPRKLLRHLGVELREMEHRGRNTFCCGAGGGKIYIDGGGRGDRPAERRIREALSLDVSVFVVACPKDVVMFAAAAQSLGLEGRLRVVDLAELTAAAVGELEDVGAPLLAAVP